MKNYTAKYSTSVLKNIEYAFQAKDMEAAVAFCEHKFVEGTHIEIIEDVEDEIIANIAKSFADELKADLTSEEMNAIIFLNNTNDYQEENICATHEYCDPNQYMLDAMEKNGFPYEFSESSERDNDSLYDRELNAYMEIFNKAWNLAKSNNFYL